MLILGIDTSGKNASVAVYDTVKELFLGQISVLTGMTHSQVIMPMCIEVLEKLDLTLANIDKLAVASGPGSYTGLRIGLSAVQAMAFGLDCECAGVPTLEALAYSNIASKGIICSIMTARSDLVYTAAYESDGYCLTEIAGECIMSHDELATELALNGREVLLCGDGSGDFFMKYQSPLLRLASPQLRVQTAVGVCLGASVKEGVKPEDLQISYLQKVKAEKDLEREGLL